MFWCFHLNIDRVVTDLIYPWLQQDPVFEWRINKYSWHVSGQLQAERSALWLRLTYGNEFSILFSQTVNNNNILPFASQQPENTPPPTPQAKALIGLAVPGLQMLVLIFVLVGILMDASYGWLTPDFIWYQFKGETWTLKACTLEPGRLVAQALV